MSNIIRQVYTAGHNIQPFIISELMAGGAAPDQGRAVTDRVISGAWAYAVPVRPFNLYGLPADTAGQAVSAMTAVPDATALHTPEAEEATEPAPGFTAQDEVADAAWEEATARTSATVVDLVAQERERLLQEAQDEAAQYLASAQEQAATLTAEAYQQGLRQGEEAARQAVATQFSPVLTAFRQATTEITHLRAAVLQQAEEDVITLAFQLARKIIQHEVQGHRQVLATTLRRALAHVAEQDQVIVRVHPDDLAYATESQQELGRAMGDIKTPIVQSDAAVGRGGCIVESSLGTIDARIEAQFEELEQRFRMQHTLDLEARVA